MKVILIEDVVNLGKKYDVKDVADGYARNFLIPNNLAKIATKEALAWLESQKDILEKKIEEDLIKAQDIASKIDGIEINIPVKVGEKGQLYEKISNSKIAEKIKEEGFDIKKDQIKLLQPIESIGEYEIKIKLEHNLESEIKVIITEEEVENA